MKYLIVNADDFGMTKGANAGIVQAITEGIVTGTSVLACGGAFDDAVRLAHANGIKEVGAHLSLTEVRSLVSRRKIKNSNALIFGLLSGAISDSEIRAEFKAQLDKIKASDLVITHLDSHQHIHILPAINRIFLDLAGEYSIPAIRLLREERILGKFKPNKAYRLLVSRYFVAKNLSDLKNSGLFYPDRLLGFLDSGKLSEGLLMNMLESLSEGVTELVAHPGFISPELLENYKWHINCEDELYALTSPRARRIVEENGIKLVSYKEALGASKHGAEGGS